jgi:hypothetical protein
MIAGLHLRQANVDDLGVVVFGYLRHDLGLSHAGGTP